MDITTLWVAPVFVYLQLWTYEVYSNVDENSDHLDFGNYSRSTKKSRFFTFNNDDGEIKIELDFSVPFLHIPIGARSNSGVSPLIDVNTKGLLTAGAMVFLFIAILPKIIKMFIPQAHASSMETLLPFMGRIDEALKNPEFMNGECYERAACWLASTPLSSSIPNFLSTSSWLRNVIHSESIQVALARGTQGGDCNVYQCSLSLQHLAKLVMSNAG